MEEAGMRRPRIPLSPSNRSVPCYAPEIKAFREFTHRRVGLIRALTEDVEEFFRKCASGMRSLYLYGNYNDAIWWEVRQPGPEELLLGINLARGNMSRIKWMQHIAMLCDAWLINIAFSSAQNMTAEQRERLFHRINSLQTVHTAFLASDTYRRLCREEEKVSRPAAEQNDQTEGEGTDEIICIRCNGRYRANAFWICCDVCKQWYHGKCVKIRAKQADQMKKYECPECLSEKSGHS
ncbi:PHD finger protein ALFIN-LIKE 3 [Setaria italica]|uniref:PHD finger protein ALFIN-LIKE 3 n=1 Tax=Setaria italica TaxID=4555 RepID=UPI000350CB03|nr:PHD finger protein ALFIN-LIKE 3 [Setaria italica]XP_034586631.1 PHD finger protein ALFIN-LIKE 3-like [Setaria viridis]